MRSCLDDNKVVRGRCLWMDYNEVVHGRCPWTMIRSGRFNRPYNGWTDERATFRKIRHVGAVDKSMIIALNSSSS